MIKEKIGQVVERAIKGAIKDGKLGAVSELTVPVVLERPRLPEHGDLACGIALKLAAQAKTSPLKLAEVIADYIAKDDEAGEENIARFNVAPPGFINFQLGTGWLRESISQVVKEKESFGRINLGDKERILIEYVSANPTGDLHIGHGRGAVYGSCLANLLKFVGFDVEQEFYINDAGVQINQLGHCAWAIYQKMLGRDAAYPDEGYPESSLHHYMEAVVKEHGDRYLSLSQVEGPSRLGTILKDTILKEQKILLERLGVNFDCWFSELNLHKEKKVDEVLELFAQNELSYQSEGALWLKADQLGDERPRVLRKSSGDTTYLAADAAYHLNKYQRGYDHLITIWGADHHGQVPGLKAAVQALGYDVGRLEIILTQIVNLSRDGQIVRMSKRAGTVVTLEEVMDEVGVDATRYYLAESNPQNPISFDLELAKKTSRENPAFYIQYAHARCSAIVRRALEPNINTESGKTEEPIITKDQWDCFQLDYAQNPEVFRDAFDKDAQIFAHQKSLVMRIESFPEEVREAAVTRLPGRLARYAYDLANDLQKFYEVSRVITDDLSVTKARLGLILATKQVLANTLSVIGVTAPERM